MHLKRAFSMVLCIALVVTLFSGCSGSSAGSSSGSAASSQSSSSSQAASSKSSSSSQAASSSSSSSASSAAGDTQTGTNTFVNGGKELSLWTFQELHVAFYTSMADIWNKQHPESPINLTVTTGDSTAMHTKLLVACQSGTGAPDICDVEIGHYATFVKGNYFLPLNDVVSPYEKDVVMSRIKMYGDNQGNYYGIDFHLGAAVTYYNMDLMKKAGIDPSTIVTWDDYFKAGKTVLEKTGKPMTDVETADLFLPQMMLLEKGVQYVDGNGTPKINTPEHAQVIQYIRDRIADGTVQIAPGGGFHKEEWYGFFNGGGAASISMPLWYMGRYTNYMTDLKGKIGIYEIPVWKQGDTRCVLQGGTGTSVTKQSKNSDLAKKFLAFAKLSKEGNQYIWAKLGFDPIRTELWFDKSITEDKSNAFLSFFATNPFDVLKTIYNAGDVSKLTAPNISGGYSAAYDVLVSTTYYNAFEGNTKTDAQALLDQEQATIVYEK